MAAKLRALFRLHRLYGRMDLQWLMQDFGMGLIVIASEIVNNLATVSGILLLAVRFGGVGGLSTDEVLFMLGFFEMADGLGYMLFGNFNIMHISRRVGRGQLDHMLIQPRSLLTQMLTEGFMPASGNSGFVMGVILTAIACHRLRMAVTPLWFAMLLLYLAMHIALKTAQSFLYGALAFYKPVACEEISTMIIDLNNQLGRFPLFGLPKALLTILHTALPVGLMAYLPALALLRELGAGLELALPVSVTAAFVLAAVACFRRGLRHYAQFSCNRYREMGHRC
ncbi:MAG: ABC-2 family transporter protein [Clostridia bacterium]|nr:ABC-2 family transporter protein [Clostridia bacterium]